MSDLRRTICFVGTASIAILGACSSATTQPRNASIDFVLVAPLCSMSLPVAFTVDGVAVGADTFRVNLANARQTSRTFTVTAGQHVVGARVPNGLVWPDTNVTLVIGATLADSLPFYCS